MVLRTNYKWRQDALVERKAAPSKDGPLVYFDGVADFNDYLNKAEGLGGKILLLKTLIAKEISNHAIFLDPEGNRLVFWSRS